jgi:hypothetical protein
MNVFEKIEAKKSTSPNIWGGRPEISHRWRKIVPDGTERKNRCKEPFRISHEEIDEHVKDYLARGGTITKVEELDDLPILPAGQKEAVVHEWFCDSGRVVRRDYPEGFFN